MYLLYTTFFFSLFAAGAMVFFRLWELEKGKIPFPENAALSKKLQVLAEWEKKAWEGARHFSMYALSLSLRLAIIGIDKARKSMRRAVSSMEESLVKKNPPKDMQGSASFFLKDIAEHKKNLRMQVREERGKTEK